MNIDYITDAKQQFIESEICFPILERRLSLL